MSENTDSVDALFQAATIASHENRLSDAESLYRKLIQLAPRHPGALHGLGLLAARSQKIAEAIELLSRALALEPTWAECQYQLGVLLLHDGNVDRAIATLRRVVELEPAFPDGRNALGMALLKQGDADGAICEYQAALSARPDHLPALINLASAFRIKGRTADAAQCLQRAATLRPDVAEIHYNLGIELKELDQLDDAISAYRRAIALRSDLAEAHLNLGNALLLTGDIDAAIAELKIAATSAGDGARAPVTLDARWTHACAVLLQGDYNAGWDLYEVRHQRAGGLIDPRFRDRLWDGGDLLGKRMLLFWEQGLGDTIQFVRYAPLVKERGAEVMLLCQPELRELLTGQLGLSKVVSGQAELPAFDVCLPLMSLPHRLKLPGNQIPSAVPYIVAPAEGVKRWARRIAGQWQGLKVGLRWAANPTFINDRQRSTTLSMFAQLGEVKNATYFSLQTGGAAQAEELRARIPMLDYTADFHSLADTAGLIANLDLIITVDTGVAHLCGAMGKPTWILTSFLPDWRWHLQRPDSPWYPTVRLFRQHMRGEWGPVVRDIAQELTKLEPVGPV